MKSGSMASYRAAAEIPDRDVEDYRETKRCENSCAHFDLINQCCWLMTANTGLCTDVEEGDYCFHGFKEDY